MRNGKLGMRSGHPEDFISPNDFFAWVFLQGINISLIRHRMVVDED